MTRVLTAAMPGTTIDLSGMKSNYHPYKGEIDIRITPATGGTIVSILRGEYGTVPDLYVVGEDQDLGVELGKIITMAFLKKE